MNRDQLNRRNSLLREDFSDKKISAIKMMEVQGVLNSPHAEYSVSKNTIDTVNQDFYDTGINKFIIGRENDKMKTKEKSKSVAKLNTELIQDKSNKKLLFKNEEREKNMKMKQHELDHFDKKD